MATTAHVDPGRDGYPDLSLARGGPFFRLATHLRLSPPLDHFGTRLVSCSICLCWLPVVLLLIAQRMATGVWDSLFTGSELHLRMLVSLSLLLWSEWLFEHRVRVTNRYLLDHDFIPTQRLDQWRAEIARLTRVRDSWIPEVALLTLVYGLSMAAFLGFLPHGVLRWLAPTIHEAGVHWAKATPAWWWYLLVSQPLFLFVVLRWLTRWMLYTHLMWCLARMPPRVQPLHADRAGGLAFLAEPLFALRFYACAASVALMSVWLDELARSHAQPAIFATDLSVFLAGSLFLAIIPYAPFVRVMVEAKHHTMLSASALMNTYTQQFGARWLHPEAPGSEPELLGHSDFSGLADLGTSFKIAEDMRTFLPGPGFLKAHLVAALAPFGLIVLIYGPSAAELIKGVLLHFVEG